MEILNNYDGASIDILEIHQDEAILSVKKEYDAFSNYYNFKVKNESSSMVKIEIRNLEFVLYKNNQIPKPYIKEKDKWELCTCSYEENGKLIIPIKEKTICEISLVPRYTDEDLQMFLNGKEDKICVIKKEFEYLENKEQFTYFKMGNGPKCVYIISRQHPGETLSSFFLEGIIENVYTNLEKYKEFTFYVFPIMNVVGTKKGVHRYLDNINFNRMWNEKEKPFEIKQVLECIKQNMPYVFLDIHNDEISTNDYIRTRHFKKDEVGGIRVLKTYSKAKRFLRALIKQKKIISLKPKTAREFIQEKYKVPSFLIELSMKDNFTYIKEKGSNFIEDFMKNL